MRALLPMIATVAVVASVLLGMRGAEQSAAPHSDTAPAMAATAPALPCSAYSEEISVQQSRVTWSYRLCGQGAERRRIDVRFRNRGAAADSLEYRIWLTEPVDCGVSAWAGPRRVALPDAGITAGEAFDVAFAAYRGELWVCAKRAGADAPPSWTPARATHGEAL